MPGRVAAYGVMTIVEKKNPPRGDMATLAGTKEMLKAGFGKGKPKSACEEIWIVVFRFPYSTICSVALDPEFTMTLLEGSITRTKFGGGTTTVTVALCDRDPEVPVTVSTYSPGRLVDDTAIVREENADEAGVRLRTEGLNETVKLWGEITDRATAPVKLKLVATTENVPCWPKSTTTLTGPDSVKSIGGFG